MATTNQQVTLSRAQIQNLWTLMSLHSGIDSVTISESCASGIGPSHLAVYHIPGREDRQEDITDVEKW